MNFPPALISAPEIGVFTITLSIISRQKLSVRATNRTRVPSSNLTKGLVQTMVVHKQLLGSVDVRVELVQLTP